MSRSTAPCPGWALMTPYGSCSGYLTGCLLLLVHRRGRWLLKSSTRVRKNSIVQWRSLALMIAVS
uniref:Uncharacterized protein n=1 Tax=Arundo donax TaxID=35708 RepID=A0A0A8XPK0_ARUDO